MKARVSRVFARLSGCFPFRPSWPVCRLVIPTVLVCGTMVSVAAQSTTDTGPSVQDSDIVSLSPFEVNSTSDVGYLARNTLGGTRLNSSLKDTASQVSVMTKEFLEDIAATNLEDAFLYSMNVENWQEYASSAGGGGDDFFNGVVDIASSRFRVRGLVAGSQAHDFFTTSLRLDTYNTDRFELASGPNAILFGIGSPSGLSNGGYIRADLNRGVFGSVALRVDSDDGVRVNTDVNVSLIPGTLAARVALLKDRPNDFRKPAGDDIQRVFATLSFRPFKNTTIRVWYEDIVEDRYPVRNTAIYDGVSAWVAAGRPLFDNGGSTANITARIAAQGLTNSVSRFANGDLRIVTDTDQSTFTQRYDNTAQSRPLSDFYPAPDNAVRHALLDGSIFPLDISYAGNATHNYTNAYIAGATIEQVLFDKLFIEAGINKEDRTNPWTDLIRGAEMMLRADPNIYLNDGVTLNPNVGRFYVEGTGRGGMYIEKREDARITASYDLDLTETNKWLGAHRIAGLLSRDERLYSRQTLDLRIIDGVPSLTTPPEENYGTYRRIQMRAYLDAPNDSNSGGVYWVNVPWNGFDNYTTDDGVTVAGVNSPYGATDSAPVEKSLNEGLMAVMQSHWLNGHVVTTLGWRRDSYHYANESTPRKIDGSSTSPFYYHYEILDQVPGWEEEATGETRTLGVVAHPLPWLSMHFSDSNSFAPDTLGHTPYNDTVPGTHGVGQDYGLTLRFLDEKIQLRLNHYDQTAGPTGSTFQGAIRSAIFRLEGTALDNGAAPHATFDPSLGSFYVVSESRRSKGEEIELIANPTASWRAAITLARTDSTQSEIGNRWLEFVQDRTAVWAQYADLNITGRTTTVSQEYINMVDDFNLMEQLEGASNDRIREWRVNVTMRYSFREGLLKGAFLGGNYRWRSDSVLGYQATEIPNEFPFPGAGDTLIVQDATAPLYGSPTKDIDFFCGYNRKILDGKVNWRIQLNVRNLFNDQAPLEQAIDSQGTLRLYGITPPRQFILSNTFGF